MSNEGKLRRKVIEKDNHELKNLEILRIQVTREANTVSDKQKKLQLVEKVKQIDNEIRIREEEQYKLRKK